MPDCRYSVLFSLLLILSVIIGLFVYAPQYKSYICAIMFTANVRFTGRLINLKYYPMRLSLADTVITVIQIILIFISIFFFFCGKCQFLNFTLLSLL